MGGMIALIQVLPIGNALRIFLNPVAGATQWVLLRKTTNDISGYNDAAAYQVLDTTVDTVVLDTANLINGTAYWYQDFYLVNGAWVAGAATSGTPASTLGGAGPDPLSLVRDRLELGLAAEVARGHLSPQAGYIQVLTAPPTFEDTRWPVVTVHLQSDQPVDRALGEMLFPDVYDSLSGNWDSSEGWVSSIALQVIAWSLNPDERIALRQAIKRVVLGNLQIFDDAGMVQIEFSQSDVDAVSGEFSAPVYQSVGNFNCLAPSLVTAVDTAITDVSVSVDPEPVILTTDL